MLFDVGLLSSLKSIHEDLQGSLVNVWSLAPTTASTIIDS